MALILLAVDPGAATAPLIASARADEVPSARADRPAEIPAQLPAQIPSGTPAQLQDQSPVPAVPEITVETLSEHIHGLEGKLKESAAARKAADQARMEAERRLAEAVQETDRLSTEIDLLRGTKSSLETQLKRAQEQNTRTAELLSVAEEETRRLGAEVATQSRRNETLERQLDQLKSDQHEAERVQSDVRDQLAERERNLAERNEELAALKTRHATVDNQLKVLSAQLPIPAGGTLTLEVAQAQSADAAATLREALVRAEASGDPHTKQALRQAEQTLHRCQFAAAQVAGARSVYQVRPTDTLALIANHFYGDSSRWRVIREANRHVLPDAHRLTPGLTLVIP